MIALKYSMVTTKLVDREYKVRFHPIPLSCSSIPDYQQKVLSVLITDLGLIHYTDALALQEEAVERVTNGGEEQLFLLEHYPVISFGRNGGEENLPLSEDFFASQGITIIKTRRGGNITCHFPGQLVVYPIMCIDKQPGGLKHFFFNLEEAVIQTLAHFTVNAARQDKRPGVWLDSRKICSIGIAVSHWITSHGLALNIGNDLSLFDMVTPCGLPGVTATSLHRETGNDSISMQEVKEVFVKNFLTIFDRKENSG